MNHVTKLDKLDDKEILDLDATSIANAIANGKITSYEAVSAYIKQIKRVNPVLNAVVEERFSEALQTASQSDKATTSYGPLHGVPISVKEAFDVSGMKTTSGLYHRQDLLQKSDSDVVKKLKNAGAIILGKTNTPTLCFCQETVNNLYGQTNNAWDFSRTAGGSSGGEGALLGIGGAAVGIGSDIGGSIRFPSHFNGVLGFKSGKFQVSQTGHFPHNTIPLQERMLGFGPMGKSIRDMQLLYSIIANNKPSEQNLNHFQIDFLPANCGYPLSGRTKYVLQEIKKQLNKTYEVSDTIPPYFKDSALIWQEIMSIDGGASVSKQAFPNDRPNIYTEFIKGIGNNSQVHPYLSWALIGAKLFKPSKKRMEEIEALIKHGDQTLHNFLQNRLLIFPVYHSAAPKHGKLYNEIFSIKKTFLKYMPYIAYANVWGLPSLTIPVSQDKYGLPISIQIMSRNGNEDAIFKLGKVIEKKFRGYQRSKLLDEV